MTATDHILAYLRDHHGQQRIGDIAEKFEGRRDTLYMAASELYKAGRIKRTAPGVYTLVADAQSASPDRSEVAALEPAPTPRKPRQKPAAPPVAEAESTTEPELELAAWHTGELTVRRGDQVVLLQPDEVRTMVRFAGRMLEVEG